MAGTFVEMELREIHISEDPRDLPIIILAEKNGNREFPIFVGHVEAHVLEEAIIGSVVHFSGQAKRPLTHDLILNTFGGLKAEFKRVLITRLEGGTFYGALELAREQGELVEIDSRPSDAMVLAMKCKIPIFVEENVLAEVQQGNFDNPD